jgi:hypothetical protein
MQIRQAGSQPSVQAPAEYFTGTVRIDPLFPAIDPSRVAGNHVTFEPGARTAWHTHPFGQTLIVTSGLGRVQRWGGPHGASVTSAMSHIAIQESLDGNPVTWMERVTDEQYGAPPRKEHDNESNRPLRTRRYPLRRRQRSEDHSPD